MFSLSRPIRRLRTFHNLPRFYHKLTNQTATKLPQFIDQSEGSQTTMIPPSWFRHLRRYWQQAPFLFDNITYFFIDNLRTVTVQVLSCILCDDSTRRFVFEMHSSRYFVSLFTVGGIEGRWAELSTFVFNSTVRYCSHGSNNNNISVD